MKKLSQEEIEEIAFRKMRNNSNKKGGERFAALMSNALNVVTFAFTKLEFIIPMVNIDPNSYQALLKCYRLFLQLRLL